ncbi:hypothetical protein AXF42_Ash003852 [Apostasia shenzhenica]|uniref:Uncharacterized protein n=1 Tax=Apostasia shenzhenica TaxID=1088818 RepID=A0A2I0AI62_9ASPA|nr:hypothetical protein AXF42_Ash003852 [Apostasia shenzhenica]
MKDRKKKGPAKPSSISSLLLNANAQSYFKMVEEIPILNVKPVILKKVDPFIREIIERQGWNKWLSCNIIVYHLIVQIFFANMKIDCENRTLETSVQGKSITVTGDDLTSFFGFSTPTDLITVTDLQVESSSFSDIESTLGFDLSFNPPGVKRHLVGKVKKLSACSDHAKTLGRILQECLIQICGHKSDWTNIHQSAVYYLLKGRVLD